MQLLRRYLIERNAVVARKLKTSRRDSSAIFCMQKRKKNAKDLTITIFNTRKNCGSFKNPCGAFTTNAILQIIALLSSNIVD